MRPPTAFPWHRMRRACTVVAMLAGLAACGGDTSPPGTGALLSPGPAPASTALYVGYYAEDRVNNPEDPTLGALYLSLPTNDTTFAGAMFFTYVGCQSSNVGTVTGTRSGDTLTGGWSGSIDGQLESGGYAGAKAAGSSAFSGTYTVTGGKQRRVVPNCVDYFIAANGTWELLPVGTTVPSTFALTASGTSVQWINPINTAFVLLAVLDETQATAGQATAPRFQSFLPVGQPTTLDLSAVGGLTVGTRYVVTVATVDAQLQRLAAGSVLATR